MKNFNQYLIKGERKKGRKEERKKERKKQRKKERKERKKKVLDSYSESCWGFIKVLLPCD